eukprot:4359171-Pyramimonas_sp.AAC.1
MGSSTSSAICLSVPNVFLRRASTPGGYRTNSVGLSNSPLQMDGRNVDKSSAVIQRKIKPFAPKVVSVADVNLMIALTGRI